MMMSIRQLGILLVVSSMLVPLAGSADKGRESARNRYPAEIGLFVRAADGEWRLARETREIPYVRARRQHFGVVIYMPDDDEHNCKARISYPGSLKHLSVTVMTARGPQKQKPPADFAHEKDGTVHITPKATRCYYRVPMVSMLDSDKDLPGRRTYKLYVDDKLVVDTYIDVVK